MPTVDTSVWVNAPRDLVYAIARDNRRFPEFMEDVLSLDVLEEEGDRIVSAWVGIIRQFGRKVAWTQEDIWDPAAGTCEFKQLKGDYDVMYGTWRLVEENGGTRFDSSVTYEFHVPGLGALIGKIVRGIVVKNMEGVLGAIKARAEAQCSPA